MANKPLILTDNLLDDVVLHPDHQVAHSGTPVGGSELWHVADNLRDLSRFTIAETGALLTITVDCAVPKAADVLVLDRGHNLHGLAVTISTSPDPLTAFTPVATRTLPALAGGLPGAAVRTPEGASWCSWPALTARRWQLSVQLPVGVAPLLTGLYLGDSYRFPEYLNAPAAYDYRVNHKALKNEVSRGGVRVRRGIVNYAEVDLAFSLESGDFPAFNAEARRLLFFNQPWWFCLDDADVEGAGLMRLFQLPGDTVFDPQVNPVHREVRLLLEEVAPLLTI